MGENPIDGIFCEMYEDDEHTLLTGGIFIPFSSSTMIAVRYIEEENER